MAHRPSFRSVPDGLTVGITQLEEIGVMFTLANKSDPRESRRRGGLEDCRRLEHRENAVNCPFGTGFMIFTAVRVDRPVADCAGFEMTDGGTYAYAALGFVGKVDRAGGWAQTARRWDSSRVPSSSKSLAMTSSIEAATNIPFRAPDPAIRDECDAFAAF
jgi:hypothetical protein